MPRNAATTSSSSSPSSSTPSRAAVRGTVVESVSLRVRPAQGKEQLSQPSSTGSCTTPTWCSPKVSPGGWPTTPPPAKGWCRKLSDGWAPMAARGGSLVAIPDARRVRPWGNSLSVGFSWPSLGRRQDDSSYQRPQDHSRCRIACLRAGHSRETSETFPPDPSVGHPQSPIDISEKYSRNILP